MIKSDIKTRKYNPDNIFFSSDVHFHHKLMTSLFQRRFASVEEMNNQIIKNWNAKVPYDAVVFYLGDFCFGGRDKWSDILDQLNGTIIFIPGNHDYQNDTGLKEVFDRGIMVREQMEIRVESYRFHLSHYPCLEWAGMKNGVINLHGHVHGNYSNEKRDIYQRISELVKEMTNDFQQFDVGIDNNPNFEPFSYFDVKERLNLK